MAGSFTANRFLTTTSCFADVCGKTVITVCFTSAFTRHTNLVSFSGMYVDSWIDEPNA